VSVTEILVITLAVGVGSLIQGAAGFGANLLAVPVLVLVDPGLVPGPALVAALALNAMIARRESGQGHLRDTAWALAGRAVGTIGGVAVLSLVTGHDIGLVVGLLLLTSVVISTRGWDIRPTPRVVVGAGLASGFMATTVAVGGPPIALVYQRAEGPVLRATLSRYLLVGTAFSIFALSVGGKFDSDGLRNGLLLVPGTVAGFALSGRLATVLDRGRMRTAVLTLSAISAVVVLADWAVAR
jgi:uncharacterized membrane protein YfcA